MSEISINNSITVRDHEIIDDLELLDDKVVTKIVDALFTTVIPDFSQDNPNAPDYIKNKPTKTSDFINDGADGKSRYVQFNELTDTNNVNDVQVSETGIYKSVVKDKIAKIDLSSFVKKEFKTGSTTEYKVLSDNNLTDEDKAKLDFILTNGLGTRALTDDGKYRELYNILKVNGIVPNQDKEIIINTQDIKYGVGTLKDILDKVVLFKSHEDQTIVLNNNKALAGTDTLGNETNLVKIDNKNVVQVGDETKDININADKRPTINTTESMAFISDITKAITEHNVNSTAHKDIRDLITTIELKEVMQLSNLEMRNYTLAGSLKQGQLVIPKDSGTYVAGKVYRFKIDGTTYSFELVSNWQIENIYRNGKPDNTTVGAIGQQYWDVANKRIYRLMSVVDSKFNWEDVTPAGGGGSSEELSAVIENRTLISDAFGGFTAGNNYKLLDGDGIIPVERIPQAVLNGLVYGGSFNSNGIITASVSVPEVQGQNISEISLAYYKNKYFLCKEKYTLAGEEYIPGNFALSTGSEWVKIANSGQVISVNGKDGVVVLNAADVLALSLEQADKDVLTELSFRYDGDNVYLDKGLTNIASDDKTNLSEQLQLASDSQAGLMSMADYQQIRNNTERIESLEGKTTRLLYTAKTDPTADEINTFVTGLGYTTPFEGIAVVVDQTFHIWHYYENDNIGWKDDGADTVNQFTNTSLGTIKGSEVDGKVYAETDGTGSVYGWGALKGQVTNIAQNLDSYVLKTTKVAGKPLNADVNLSTLRIKQGGADIGTYDGSEDFEINLPDVSSADYQIITTEPEDKSQGKMVYENVSSPVIPRYDSVKTTVYGSPQNLIDKYINDSENWTWDDVRNLEWLGMTEDASTNFWDYVMPLDESIYDTLYSNINNPLKLKVRINGAEQEITANFGTVSEEAGAIWTVSDEAGTYSFQIQTQPSPILYGGMSGVEEVPHIPDIVYAGTQASVEILSISSQDGTEIWKNVGKSSVFDIINLKIADGTQYNSLKDLVNEGMQEKLTAGTGITIENNVISSSVTPGQTIQYAAIPEAKFENLNKVIQYVGETDASYTNGYFYKCIESSEQPKTFNYPLVNESDPEGIPQYVNSATFEQATQYSWISRTSPDSIYINLGKPSEQWTEDLIFTVDVDGTETTYTLPKDSYWNTTIGTDAQIHALNTQSAFEEQLPGLSDYYTLLMVRFPFTSYMTPKNLKTASGQIIWENTGKTTYTWQQVDVQPASKDVETDGTTITKTVDSKLQAVGLQDETDSKTLTAHDIWLACSIEREV